MRDITRVAQAVSDLLPTEGMGPTDRHLVLTFVRWREEAASRLSAFTAALDAGDEYRALQIAEMEPPLPDFVAYLGLVSHLSIQDIKGRSEEQLWAAYCRKHDIPVPPTLDSTAIERLHNLYRQGITTSSPFYHECLAAISAGDEERALVLIRSIVRLAQDVDARAHMERMLRKRAVPQLMALRTCLEQGHEEGVLGWLNEFERSGADSVLTDDPVYAAGVAARNVILQRRATAEAGAILSAAAAAAKADDWPTVRAGLARIRRLESEWEARFTPEQTAVCASLEKQAAAFLSWVRNKEAFDRALAALMAFAERKHNQLHEKSNQSLLELQTAQQTLADLWKQAEAFNLPIPHAELNRLYSIAELLQTRLRRRRDLHRLGRTALFLPLVVLGVGIIWAGIAYFHARNQLSQLEELHEGKFRHAANNVLQMMMRSYGGWLLRLSPDTRAKLEDLRKWTELCAKRLHDVEAKLAEIEGTLNGPLDKLMPEALMEKFAAANVGMKDLANDDVGQVRARMRQLQDSLDSILKSLLASNLERVTKAIAELQRLADALDFEKPVAQLSVILASLQEGLQAVEPLEHPTVAALNFPEETTAALRRLRSTARLYSAEMSDWARAKDAMSKAEGLNDYRWALEQLSTLRFGECREAAKMFTTIQSEDETGAKLFFRGDLDAWQMTRQQAARKYQFIPEGGMEEELAGLSMICTDPNFSTGGARKLLEAIRLPEALDAARGKIATPLIEMIDRVFRSAQQDVIVRAYVARELYATIQPRKLAWGLHYTPELSARMAELDSIVSAGSLRSGDWNRPESRKASQARLQTFFQAAAKRRSFWDLAVSYRDLVAPAALKGISYAGFVDEARVARLKIPEATPGIVWGWAGTNQQLVPVERAAGSADSEAFKDLRKWSPLLIIPVDPREAAGRLTVR